MAEPALRDEEMVEAGDLPAEDGQRFMRLDASVESALNVLPSNSDAATSFSLFGLLNKAVTPMGKALLKTWLKQPLTGLAAINERHDCVEALHGDAQLRVDLRGLHFRGMPDLGKLCTKLEKEKISLQELCQLYRASVKLPQIEAAVVEHAGPHAALMKARFVDPLRAAHDPERLGKFEELLEAAVDMARVPDEYLIAPTYDAGLAAIDEEKAAAEQQLNELAAEAAHDLGLVLDKTLKMDWHKTSNQRLRCLRITAKEEKTVRAKLRAKYLEIDTKKDGTKFFSKPMKAAAERLQQLSRDYEKRQGELLAQVVSVAATFAEVWGLVRSTLAQLDLLAAFAEVAAAAPAPYTRPLMLPETEGEIVLRGSRHPCLEAQEGVDFIPNDCLLTRGESWFQIITGPNMGGKSTFIRQVGLAVLMAQIGSFVPADSARIAVRDALFARVGAGDCQQRGLSTFMAEMLETAAILKDATSRSLVIVDELGRGTSTWEGMGLAWAISEHLCREVGCATLFATHFHDLAALESSLPGAGVANLHVKAAESESGLTMLYQVHKGASAQSYGLAVARFARLPPEVIEAAAKRLAELEPGTAAVGAHPAAAAVCRAEAPGGAACGGKEEEEAARQLLQRFAELPLEAGMPPDALAVALQQHAIELCQ
ncbi:DNA mismatch repair MSH2 [Micractinium conductrix]|uniref:DNA mismatch repair MSH2 n=1 Tax=Micractinium conductrix TaxID=554055 RepID=A0A2P6VCZ6_9CHLO|nr:DNA mismatch repair MSH2 [Micractinium conductrix]|eukprot:PSC71954.1 DNA mismatch repair MSH2 [Micractinium conductrix]